MLGLNIDVDIDVKKVKLPIYFEKKNICVHCGGEGTLIFIDKFGRETKSEVNAFDHIKCKRCGRRYSILWQPDENKKSMYPSAVNPSIQTEFSNLVKHTKLAKKGKKEFE